MIRVILRFLVGALLAAKVAWDCSAHHMSIAETVFVGYVIFAAVVLYAWPAKRLPAEDRLVCPVEDCSVDVGVTTADEATRAGLRVFVADHARHNQPTKPTALVP